MAEYEVVFRSGRAGTKQANLFENLQSREIYATKYADDTCLQQLGLYDSVNYMLDHLGLNYFLSKKEPVYVKLTLEFLSSLIVATVPDTRSSSGTIYFRMFNVDYKFSFDDLADLLHFSHGNRVICEIPEDRFEKAYRTFWRIITAKDTDSFEGNTASSIHNPTLRYLRQLLSCTIFGRAHANKVNSKELFYMWSFITKEKINSLPFMFSHMQSVISSNRGAAITFGGLITTIAKAIGVGDHQFANLEQIPPRFIDLDMVKSMKLVKQRSDGNFFLMINNQVFSDIILPNPSRTDVRNINWNLCYVYNPHPDELEAPTTVPNVAAGRGTNVVQPAHTTHFSNTFAGSSSSSRQSTIDDVPCEMRAQNAINEERDGLFYAIHQQQEQMLKQMQFVQVQQNQMLHNQQQLHGYYNQWQSTEVHRQQQLDRIVHELGDLRLQFDNFQRHQQPPHD
ncbi:hypothetical protein QL285_071305 [Trifolium repens]|nr:hypothetical protein QL285_071305 [Trifolium repens]